MVVLRTALLLAICAVCSIHSQNTKPPSITWHPQNTLGLDLYIIDKRVPIELECDADGMPPPTYQWKKFDKNGENPVLLDENDERVTITDGNLRIANTEGSAGASGETLEMVTDDDEGVYQCIAQNTYGSALSKKVNASIAFMDQFSWTERQQETHQVGSKVVLQCNPPMGVPPSNLAIYWTFGSPGEPVNKPVEYNDRVLQDVDGNLVFSNVKKDDEFNFICNVPNYYIGEVKTSPLFSLTVRTDNPAPDRAPQWVYKPSSSLTVLRTKKLNLRCIAEGKPTPNIEWSWDDGIELGNRIEEGPQGAELKIRDLSYDDAGDYTCTASNGEGQPISYTVDILVESAPFWDPSPPDDTTIAPKESVTITCQAGGSPPSAISWLVNGVPSSEAEQNPRRRINSGTGSGQVIVTNAEETDSAVFQCLAKNKHGEEITSVFLNVLAIPAEIRKRPKPEYEEAEGADVEMNCKPFGRPQPTVTWTFNGQRIGGGEGGKYSIEKAGSNEGMLTISNVDEQDAGTYTCNVTNDSGTEAAYPRLVVRKKTTITEGPGDIEVIESENAVLQCVIDYDPALELEVTWSFNGVVLDIDRNNDRYRKDEDDHALTVVMTKRQDGGEYTCRAITTFSEASASGMLTVLSEPDAPINVELTNPDVNNLQVDVQWTPGFDGNTDITEYTIEKHTEFDDLGWSEAATVSASTTSATVDMKAYNTYTFRVKSRNRVGLSQPSEESDRHTTTEKKPSMNPQGVTGGGPQPGLMVVTWDRMHPTDYAGPNFKYVVRYRVKGETEWQEAKVGPEKTSYNVQSDVVFQEYEVQVVSENGVGRNDGPVDTVEGFSGESEPTAAPANVNVTVLSPENIRVSWDPVPPETINGKIKKYIVYISIEIAANSEKKYECLDNPCVLSNLTPFNDYSLQVAVENGKGEGPKSNAIKFSMPEGKPSEVLNLEVRASSDRILAKWEKPEKHNGILRGYTLRSEELLGNQVLEKQEFPIDDADQLRQIIEDLDPEKNYRITVMAKTEAGEGKPAFAETKTREMGAPTPPGKPVFEGTGTDHVNVSYKLPNEGAAADYISVRYHKKDEDESKAKTTEPVDVFEQEIIHVKGLDPSTKYVFQLIAKNSEGEVAGDWDEEKTSGTAPVVRGFKVEGWFVALIVIIIILLLILLIICVLKSQKGGKYNVSDKEQQLKGNDIESTPLKDEAGFEEYQPRDGNMDEAPLTGGSHPSLNESEAGSSETDSLKEYAEGDTGKFNEEGSFIGQYGDRKTRPPDDSQGGEAAYSTFV